MHHTFISLESLEIARPCRANWNSMTGDEQTRFCGSCRKNVYNLSEMTRDEAMRLILQQEGHLCVRLHRRSDGTVITSDCPVGQTQPKRAPVARVFVAMLGFVAALVGFRGAFAQSNPVTITAGEPVMMGAPPIPTPMPSSVKHHATRTRPRTARKTGKPRHQRHRR